MDIKKVILDGLTSEMSPGVLKGFLLELLKDVSVEEAALWVSKNEPLWDKISPEFQKKIRDFAPKLGDISWLTADWLITNLKDKKPALASLFLGWKKGHNWLERQLEIFKEKLK